MKASACTHACTLAVKCCHQRRQGKEKKKSPQVASPKLAPASTAALEMRGMLRHAGPWGAPSAFLHADADADVGVSTRMRMPQAARLWASAWSAYPAPRLAVGHRSL